MHSGDAEKLKLRALKLKQVILARDDPMIKRIWHGYTTPENADAYERLLDTAVFPGIEAKKIPGYRAIELLRRTVGDEVEFTTVMSFDSLDNVIAFQGRTTRPPTFRTRPKNPEAVGRPLDASRGGSQAVR